MLLAYFGLLLQIALCGPLSCHVAHENVMIKMFSFSFYITFIAYIYRPNTVLSTSVSVLFAKQKLGL